MKAWHVMVLAGSILVGSLGGSAMIAAALSPAPGERYYYGTPSQPGAAGLIRVDKATGAVQLYDPGEAKWVDYGPLLPKR